VTHKSLLVVAVTTVALLVPMAPAGAETVPGVIEASPSHFTLQPCPVNEGCVRTQVITVTNISDSTVAITGLAAWGQAFLLDYNCAFPIGTLAPGESCFVELGWSPDRVGHNKIGLSVDTDVGYFELLATGHAVGIPCMTTPVDPSEFFCTRPVGH
jgi:hypothetical protein